MSFLDDWQLCPLSLERAGDFTPIGLALGRGPHALEVAVVRAPRRPTHAAHRFPSSVVPELGGPLPGIRNEGFLATHQLVKWGTSAPPLVAFYS